MWHLVCGDAAVPGLRQVLCADACVRVLRDDLAVGPLADIERPPCEQRVAFWQAVWPASAQPAPAFAAELAGDARWLAALAEPVTVWHGDSASEQLLLCRVAAALAGEVPLWEVSCGRGDSRQATGHAVSRHPPEALARFAAQPVAAERRARLAQQWRDVLAEGSLLRRWRHGVFHGESFDALDHSLLVVCGADWQPLARVMATVMAGCDGFFATDTLLYWRARELAALGRLQLDGAAQAGYAERRVRLAQP